MKSVLNDFLVQHSCYDCFVFVLFALPQNMLYYMHMHCDSRADFNAVLIIIATCRVQDGIT